MEDITLKTLLMKFIPSKEIKQRINNRQIKINNEPETNSNSILDIDSLDSCVELGDFIYNNIDRLEFINLIGDIKTFFGKPVNIPRYQFLSAYTLLSISKHEHYVLIKKSIRRLKVCESDELSNDVIGLDTETFWITNEHLNKTI